MTVTSNNGALVFDAKEYKWKRKNGELYVNDKEICPNCSKPRLDINGVKDCDFCLQGLTTSEFIDYACCGHGDDSKAYISLKDGRRFVLDKGDVE